MKLFDRLTGRTSESGTQPLGHAVNTDSTNADVERRTQELGQQLLNGMRQQRKGLFSSKAWSEKIMDMAMDDPNFKVQLFRFVDVFPMLKTPESVFDVLQDYMQQPGVNVPSAIGMGLKAGGVMKSTMAKSIGSQISSMATNFIAGTDAASALPKLEELWRDNMAFSVDLLGEACLSDFEAAEYQRRYLELIDHLPAKIAAWPKKPHLESDFWGEVPRANVSIKISSLSARVNVVDFEGTLDGLYASLKPILQAAAKNNVLVNFDMEQSSLKDLTLSLFERCCERIDFTAGIAMQAYLRSAEADAQRIIDWAKANGRQITVRLIKGAYWDFETIHAEQNGWPVPVWSRKEDTDACFERVTERFISQMPKSRDQGGVKLALGSHNVRSIAKAQALLEQHGFTPNALEYQLLEGMADELKAALVQRNHRVRSYVPIGEMIPGMAYLVRRLLENTSNESWLRGSQSNSASDARLLHAPNGESTTDDPGIEQHQNQAVRHRLSPALQLPDEVNSALRKHLETPFFTEPLRDFSVARQRSVFAGAVQSAQIPVIPKDISLEAVDQAIASAAQAFASWASRPVWERAVTLVRTAAELRSRRDEIAGIVTRESGKPWVEADADVCEAIDFCEYYAREAIAMFEPQRLGQFVGELNVQHYQPLGVSAIISPWNFPLAICTGMTVASLVTGNTTMVKPAEQSPACAWLLCQALWDAGVPRDVLHFTPGPGPTVGAKLVEDPRVSLIGFTGSREVGFGIMEAAGRMRPGQIRAKKVICEMGGKNAIIVDSTADLDEAVGGVRQSAFGYAGQKCSACSRVIVVGDAYDDFLRRLVEATKALAMGDPLSASTDIGPVIDNEAAAKIRKIIDVAKAENHLELALEPPAELAERLGKPFVGPHIFSNVRPDDTIAREEIFGPVLAVMRADSFEQALAIANGSEYKLTGAVFSRTPSNLDLAKRSFLVGNLYINRGSTGALVGRQPFGGFGHSGTGTKAGGPDYLRHFVDPILVCENTMRRGFAPGLVS